MESAMQLFAFIKVQGHSR